MVQSITSVGEPKLSNCDSVVLKILFIVISRRTDSHITMGSHNVGQGHGGKNWLSIIKLAIWFVDVCSKWDHAQADTAKSQGLSDNLSSFSENVLGGLTVSQKSAMRLCEPDFAAHI